MPVVNETLPTHYLGDHRCNMGMFKKIKFTKNMGQKHTHLDEADTLKYVISQIQLHQDMQRYVSTRNIYGSSVFDNCIANVGGVIVILYIAGAIIGQYFAQRFFV